MSRMIGLLQCQLRERSLVKLLQCRDWRWEKGLQSTTSSDEIVAVRISEFRWRGSFCLKHSDAQNSTETLRQGEQKTDMLECSDIFVRMLLCSRWLFGVDGWGPDNGQFGDKVDDRRMIYLMTLASKGRYAHFTSQLIDRHDSPMKRYEQIRYFSSAETS